MNHYCNYMDRITAPASLHEKLLAKARPAHRKTRYAPALGLAAACCLLAAVGLWRPWNSLASHEVSPTAGVAVTPAITDTAPPEEQGHTLTVDNDPFHGQPHSFYGIESLSFPDCTNSQALMVDYGIPDGWFSQKMTAEDILSIFGSGDEIPWSLCWLGFGLDGTVVYNSDGTVWNASIHGVQGTESFTMTLWPGQYPLLSPQYSDAATDEVNGVEVTTSMVRSALNDSYSEEFTCRATFQVDTLGMDFLYTGTDEDAAAWLSSVFVWNATLADSVITTANLTPRTNGENHADLDSAVISGDSSRELTQDEAYQEDLSIFFPNPNVLPSGFSFESATRTTKQDCETLSILFTQEFNLNFIRISAARFPAYASLLAPDFQPDEISPSTLENWGSYVDYDQGDTPGWRYPAFTIHYPQVDGTTVAVTWHVQGVTPDDLYGLVTGCAISPIEVTLPELPSGTPKVYPLQ